MSPHLEKLVTRSAHVVVMGIGHVGLPLAVEFARAGFRVSGLDTDGKKTRALNEGLSYVRDVQTSELSPYVDSGRLDGTTDPSVLEKADVVVICVPTPLNEAREPDMGFIVAATEAIARHQHAGMVVVLESATYPGTTTELLVPRLTRGGFAPGTDVFIAYSPERLDPGNVEFRTRNTPRVVGGVTPACLEHAVALYATIVDDVVRVSSTETAEMVKLLENTFRAVNVGLANEVAIMGRRLGIDAFEVIRAAATKPFGFMPFYPGPGLGGHCIPIDPLYLSWKLRALDYRARFIELADTINGGMPEYVLERAAASLKESNKELSGARVLVYGITYKRDVADVRESPALDVMQGLVARGAIVSYMDPNVSALDEVRMDVRRIDPSASFTPYDLVLITTDHADLDRLRLLREAELVLDTRDALRGIPGDRSKIHTL